MSDQSSPSAAPKSRSPAFPFIPLSTAIDRLEALEQMFTRHPIPATKAGLAWQMKENSSQAFQTLAALKYFGFIEYQGSGANRQAIITDQARRYLRAQQPHIKEEVLQQAALAPKAIAARWDRWGADRPPDPVCLDELVLNDGFTDSAAENFLRVYDETIAFAGLVASDTVEAVKPEPDPMQQHHQHEFSDLQTPRAPTPPSNFGDMTVSLKGDKLEVSAFVDLKGAKRLMRALKANIALLEDDDDDGDDEE